MRGGRFDERVVVSRGVPSNPRVAVDGGCAPPLNA